MDLAIVIVWWIALLGALVLTVVAVLEIARVVHHAREIDRLAKVALPAAVGIVGNTAIIAALEAVVPVVGRLAGGAGALAETSASITRRVAAVGRALAGGPR